MVEPFGPQPLVASSRQVAAQSRHHRTGLRCDPKAEFRGTAGKGCLHAGKDGLQAYEQSAAVEAASGDRGREKHGWGVPPGDPGIGQVGADGRSLTIFSADNYDSIQPSRQGPYDADNRTVSGLSQPCQMVNGANRNSLFGEAGRR